MNRRIPIALAAALLISGGSTYLLGRKMNFDSFSRQQQLIHYIAPAHALEAGEVLRASDLTSIDWPRADALQGAMKDAGAAVGRAVLYPVEQGQPLLERDLGAAGTGGGLGGKIPRGMRALALRSDEVVGVAGFLAPGSRVDVLVSYHVTGHTAEASDAVTATAVQNAEVLASGQQAEPDPQGKPMIATVVTLLLSPVDAERAVAASTQGAIHFVLRNALDKEEVASAPVSLSGFASDLPGTYTGAGSGVQRTSGAALSAATRVKRDRRFAWQQQNVGGGIETVFGAEADTAARLPGPGNAGPLPSSAASTTNQGLGGMVDKGSQP